MTEHIIKQRVIDGGFWTDVTVGMHVTSLDMNEAVESGGGTLADVAFGERDGRTLENFVKHLRRLANILEAAHVLRQNATPEE